MLASLLNILFPKFCVSCGQFNSYLCLNCQKEILQTELVCPVCERPSIGGVAHPGCRKRYSLDGLWFLGSYNSKGISSSAYLDPLRKIIQKLKYRFVKEVAVDLVDLTIDYWARFTPEFFEEIKKDPSSWVVVPVPLHPKRERWRGFNQSAELAKLLSLKMGLRYEECLKRIKNTKPQMKLNSKDRHHNIKNAFVLTSDSRLLTTNILLVDDVWTTGSTLKECCNVLKKGGAKKVWAITLAR